MAEGLLALFLVLSAASNAGNVLRWMGDGNDVEPRFQGEWEISATFSCLLFSKRTSFVRYSGDVEDISVAPSQQLRVDLVAVEVSSGIHVSHEISLPRYVFEEV